MTEKEKAIEDGTIELPTGPAEKKKPHRGRIVVITVAALALLAAGGIAWRTYEDRLMAEARADCAAESERLRVARFHGPPVFRYLGIHRFRSSGIHPHPSKCCRYGCCNA